MKTKQMTPSKKLRKYGLFRYTWYLYGHI